jgi:hypothetical protein
MRTVQYPFVPAKAGTQAFIPGQWLWIPAYAGMNGRAR